MVRVKAKPRRAIIQNSPEKSSSSEDEISDGFRQGERQQNEVAPRENVQESGSQQSSEFSWTADAEKIPLPGPSSEGNKGRNLKQNKKRNEGKKVQSSSSVTEMDSKKIRIKDKGGECGECNKRFADIFGHSKNKHSRKLKKCTASGCKIYFASDQKRSQHVLRVHQVWKKFRCQFCHYSTDHKGHLNDHVLRRHSEKNFKCRELNCGNMFAFEADMIRHVNDHHRREKCPTCSKEMTVAGLRQHNFYGRCRGAAE